MYRPLIDIAFILADHLKVNVDENEMAERMKEHADYPNLSSLMDALWYYGIGGEAYQLSDLSLVKEINQPFLFRINEIEGHFALCTRCQNGQITFIKFDKTQKIISFGEFERLCSGHIFIPEIMENRAVKNSFLSNLESYATDNVVYGIAALYIALNCVLCTFDMLFLLPLIKSIGLLLGISAMHVKHGVSDAVSSQLCSIENLKTGCSSIINSRLSNLTPFLSLPDLVVLYFGFTLLLCAGGESSAFGTLLLGLSVLAVCSAPVSLYYQLFVFRSYCNICNLIILSLILECGFQLYFSDFVPFSLPNTNIVLFCSFALTMAGLATFIFSRVIQGKSWQKIQKELVRKLKTIGIKELIKNYKEASETDTVINTRNEAIILGRRDARFKIKVVSSLTCQHCQELNQEIYTWVIDNENVSLEYFFNVDISKVNKTLDSIVGSYLSGDLEFEAKFYQFLKGSNFEPSKQNVNEARIKEFIEAQQHVIQELELRSVPAIYLNDYKIPTAYNGTDDLAYSLRFI